MSHLFSWLAARLGIARLARQFLVRQGRFVLMFHSITEKHYSELAQGVQTGLTVSELDQILQWVKQHFNLLKPSQFLCSDRQGILLTFDDGMANNYIHALPILERYEAPAIFFISTQHVLNPRDWLPYTRKKAQFQWKSRKEVPKKWSQELFNGMSEQEVAACAAHPLITIGSHTVSHPFLTQCEPMAVERELVESRHQLENLTAQVVDLFAYPTGDYNRSVAESVREAGYRAAFAVRSYGVNMPLYEIPRVGIWQADTYYLDAKLSGLYHRPVESFAYSEDGEFYV